MARGDFPSAKQDQYMLRFPDGMRDALKVAASDNGRSLNAEIVARLQRTIDEERFIKAGSKELAPDDYLSKLTDERRKFEALLHSYQQIFKGFTPDDVSQMYKNYETFREVVQKTGRASDDHSFKDEKT